MRKGGFKKPARCGIGACVEVDLDFQKPKRCGVGMCVEVAMNGPLVAVRDSKQGVEGMILIFDHLEWQAFIAAAKAGQYDV